MNKLYKILTIIIVFITIINVYLFYLFQKKTVKTDTLSNQSQEIIKNTSTLLNYIIDAETGQRGFIITNDIEYLNPYIQGLDKSKSQIAQIRDILKDEDKLKKLDKIEELVLEKFDSLAQVIVLANDDINMAIELISSNKGKLIMDELKVNIDEFILSEENNLKEYIKSHKKSLDQLIMSLFIELFLVFVLLYLIYRINLNLKKASEEIHAQNRELNEKHKELNLEKEKTQKALKESQASEEEAISSQEELLVIQEELLYANAAKSEFLSNMSHEIRTPLNGIIGFIDIMMEENPRKEQVEYLNIIKKSSNSLKGIINDILDFSKIQAGKFQIIDNHYSLFDQIENIKHLFTYQIEQKGLKFNITIDKDVENIIKADELRLNQILINLLGNAYKFTDNGLINLHISVVEKNSSNIELKFAVIDTGVGIDDKIQPILFDSFTQGEKSNTKKFQGTGLGLSISKSLVELMGGEIWFESYLGLGTKFYFTIPTTYIKEDETTKTLLNKKVTKFRLCEKLKALVAEDSEINQKVILNTLSQIGFDVEFANDGFEALDKVRQNKYDVIFMDIQMPNLDGFETTARIRNFNKLIPIFALSAAVMEEDIALSLEVGMNGHIKKPIEKEELYINLSKFFDLEEIDENAVSNEKIDDKVVNQEETSLYFDVDKIAQRRDMSKEFVLELIDMFKDSFMDYPKKLKDIYEEEELSFLIHKLKSAVGNLYLEDLVELCKEYKISTTDRKKELVQEISLKLQKYLES